MIQIVHCDECKGTNIGLGSVSVKVELNKHHFCDTCHSGHDEKTSYFFCSQACFLRYSLKVTKGEKNFEFHRYGIGN
jgi:hypothetical protein